MKKTHVISLFILSLFLTYPLLAQPFAIKDKIESLQDLRSKVSVADKGELLLDLAKLYLLDQQFELAMETYLKALEASTPKPAGTPSQEEMALYDEVLAKYLEIHSGSVSRAQAHEILQEYADLIDEHPDYNYFHFLMAVSYANVGDYEQFFELFYQSHLLYPDSYMSHRTKAVLYTKLAQRGKKVEERDHAKAGIFVHARKALEKYPEDVSLYKMIIDFSPEKGRAGVTMEVMEQMISQDRQIPRKDIYFFVVNAVETDQKFLAERFLDKAREWYSYSQQVEKSQRFLDRH